MGKRGFIDHKTTDIDNETQELLKSKEKWICTTRVSLWTYRKNFAWAIFYILISIILLLFIRENTWLSWAGDGETGLAAEQRYNLFTLIAEYWGKWYTGVIKIFPLLLAWNYIQTALVQILCFKLILTNSRIIIVNGFVSKDTTDLKLDKIETMRVNQDIMGQWLHYGDLIFHGTGDTKIMIGGVDQPYKFKKYVDHYQQEDHELEEDERPSKKTKNKGS